MNANTRSDHTPEPWGPDEGPLMVGRIEPMTLLTTRDYKRARICVNAFAGLNPEGLTNILNALKSFMTNGHATSCPTRKTGIYHRNECPPICRKAREAIRKIGAQ